MAGAFVAASLALALTILGVGLGLSSVSPWTGVGAGAAAVGASAVMWLVVSQSISAGLGGYIAGRLRVKWASVHDDEVYFRDTAHGLLVWAVGVAITAAFLASAASAIVGVAAKAGTAAVAGVGAMGAATAGSSMTSAGSSVNGGSQTPQSGASTMSGYLTDSLLRSDRSTPDTAQAGRSDNTQGTRMELGRILAEGVRSGSLAPADRTYAAQVVAAQTGLSQADAEARVDAIYTKAKTAAADAETAARNAADQARRAAAKTSLWTFVALLVGAFCACVAATLGGSQRDRKPAAYP